MKQLFIFLLLLGSCTLCFAKPGHYFVFELDQDGNASPVYYRAVEFDGLAEVSSEAKTELAQAEQNPDQLVLRSGSQLSIEHTPRTIRGEFAKRATEQRPVEGTSDAEHLHGSAIESFSVPMARRAFAVRLWDEGPGQRFTLTHAGRSVEFSVAELLSQRGKMALDSYAPEVSITRAPTVGPSANRADLLLLGDGYTSSEQALFNSHASTLESAIFNLSPYREYQNFVNWTTGFVTSAQSGADHPIYQNGCTQTSCCNDTGAQNDPRAGQFVNTAFDARFCTAQIHRLLTINASKVTAAAAAFPNWDKILVVVNDDVYGGAGGSISTTSSNAAADQIVLHEHGHSFHRLADEYETPFPGFGSCSDTGGTPCEANVTNVTDPNSVKWKLWFTPGNAIPTPNGTAGVGLFQGARYLSTGMYRPIQNCLMRSLGTQFCDVCKEAYVKTLYRGGFGAPSSGIALIDPGSTSPSPQGFSMNIGETRRLSASVLSTVPNTITSSWRLASNQIGTGSFYDFTATQAGTFIIELVVTDTTTLIKPANSGGPLEARTNWIIVVSAADTLLKNGFE